MHPGLHVEPPAAAQEALDHMQHCWLPQLRCQHSAHHPPPPPQQVPTHLHPVRAPLH